ncbi:MAG: hypothetical protein ABJN65_00645 [Parasphingorhabdus sp.]
MMGYYRRAGTIIEGWVARNHPQSINYAWQLVTPNTEWNYTRNGWRVDATVIVDDFNSILTNEITVPAYIKDNLLAKKVEVFQYFLAKTAFVADVSAEAKAAVS